MDKNEEYCDFTNVQSHRNMLAIEELPEGPYGSPFGKDEPVQNKSSEWRKGQRYYSAFRNDFPSPLEHGKVDK
ncbi:hypothetical protein D0469_07935 [Peribacillus saganii]|uniref:Cytosolic protein n=1 Tax=Peribacillus saganii TaxID=2303992 RepID=A0A372LPQ4_9BACI|nr:hypothetical protein [Peribacillus saganii]RFU70102.1 hypothetical protein D0469_07935 [Peribacillus saganii]